jgi:hypothetical protein
VISREGNGIFSGGVMSTVHGASYVCDGVGNYSEWCEMTIVKRLDAG